MNHNIKINYYKTKYKFFDIFHTITGILLAPLVLVFLYFLEEGNESAMQGIVFLFVIDLIVLFVLTFITNQIGNAADDYCSEHMLKPIICSMINVSSYELKGRESGKRFRNSYIFPVEDKVLKRSSFKGMLNNAYVEGFDFASYTNSNWGVKSYGGKGHFGIVRLHNPFPGKMIIVPNTLEYKITNAIGSFFRRDHMKSFMVNDSDFHYQVSTNNPQATNYVLSQEVMDIIKSFKMKYRQIPYIQFEDEYAYVLLIDNYWPCQPRRISGQHHAKGKDGHIKLINPNGIWGAKNAEEIENRMTSDWSEMITLMSICARF